MKLVIGNKNYSSWSLRAWLLMRVKNIPFAEERIPLDQPDTKASILAHSAAGRVPVLIDDGTTVWDTLAIAEYLAEKYPDRGLWPSDVRARARARSVVAEMHSGFAALRSAMPMNCRGSFPGKGITDESQADIARIVTLWEQCCTDFGIGGGFLFGDFCVADAFFAPVVSRFATYAVPLKDTARRYADAVGALPAMREWLASAWAESEFIAADEPYRA
jgi:glutathione S-transferase